MRCNIYIGFLVLSIGSIFAADTNITDISKIALIDLSQAIEQTFRNFECKYNYYSIVLPGTREVHPDLTDYRVNENGYNNISSIDYKKLGNAFCFKEEDLFDIKSPSIVEKHSDGKMFWESQPDKNNIVLCANTSYLPPLYSDLIVNFERGPSYYSNFNLQDTLQQLITTQGNEVEIVRKPMGMIELRIIKPIPKGRFPEVSNLYTFIISTSPDFLIYSYSWGRIYKKGNIEHVFNPDFQISYSDFRKISPGRPKIPWRLEYTSFALKTQELTKNIEEWIKLDQNGDNVATGWGLITVNSFSENPTFAPGEIAFNYPAGTHVFDQFAHRSYIIGDTLEILRKKIEPPAKP